MTRFVRTTIFGVALFLLPLWTLAEVGFRASVDRNVVSLADRIMLRLEISGSRQGEPKLPEMEGVEILGRSSRAEFSLVNGATSVKRIFSYTLVPMRTGEIRIPSASLVAEGKTFRSRPITVKVVDVGSELPAPPSRESRGNSPPSSRREKSRLFVTASVDHPEVFVNQQLDLSFRLFREPGLNLGNLGFNEPPVVGFVSADNKPREDRYGTTLEGGRYSVLEMKRAIFPISPGELVIESAEFKGDILTRLRRGDPFFGGVFADPFAYEREPFLLRTDPVSIRVKPLPPGAPPDFSGAVGVYRMNAEVSPDQVAVGEPVTVTVTVQGLGNLDAVAMPSLEVGEDFRSYDPEVSTQTRLAGDRVGGTKVFRQALVPLSSGRKQIPPVRMSYFDPAAGTFRQISSEPAEIKVTAAPSGSRARLVEASSGADRRKVEVIEKDILYIKPLPQDWAREGKSFWLRRSTWALQVIPLILIFLAWRFQVRRERLSSDRIYARKVGASRSVRRRFAAARRLLREGKSGEFCAEVDRAVTRYLGDRLGLPSGAVDARLVSEKLAALAVPEGTERFLRECFETCSRLRFAPAGPSREEMEQLLELAEGLVSRLEKVKL